MDDVRKLQTIPLSGCDQINQYHSVKSINNVYGPRLELQEKDNQ
jgi:hypothetical protein